MIYCPIYLIWPCQFIKTSHCYFTKRAPQCQLRTPLTTPSSRNQHSGTPDKSAPSPNPTRTSKSALPSLQHSTNKSSGPWTNSIQPIWIAGKVMSHPSEHKAILNILERIERETGWGTSWRREDLKAWWGDCDDWVITTKVSNTTQDFCWSTDSRELASRVGATGKWIMLSKSERHLTRDRLQTGLLSRVRLSEERFEVWTTWNGKNFDVEITMRSDRNRWAESRVEG